MTPLADIFSQAQGHIDGVAAAVAGVGDVNGDGVADLALGEPNADGEHGVVRVVFGGQQLGRLATGFTIRSERSSVAGADNAGAQVSALGDVNGDGLADILVGAPEAKGTLRPAPNGIKVEHRGAAYVVFGQRNGADVDLARLAGRGFVIRGASDGIGGVGDVNGDGVPDFAVGRTQATAQAGRVYVVLGGPTTDIPDVDDLGARGFTIDGAPGDLTLGASIDRAGDFNGDGVGDIVLGDPNSLARPVEEDDREPIGPGAADIVFGSRQTANVALGSSGGRAVRIAAHTITALGTDVAAAGDVNDDGRDDVIVGAPLAGTSANVRQIGPGGAFVIFGDPSTATIDVAQLGSRGQTITGPAGRRAGAGGTVAGLGDVDGDGRPDLAVGEPGYDAGDEVPGGVSVILGDPAPGTIPAGAHGARYVGRPGERLGSALGAADLNGDGRAELVAAAPGACAGTTLVLDFAGAPLPAPSPGRDVFAGTRGDDVFAGGDGDDSLRGGDGADCLLGDAGDDRLRGDAGRDRLEGGSGDDRLSGGAQSDVIDGGAGADRIDGGTGVDELAGGSGDDVVIAASNAGDRLPHEVHSDVERLDGGSGDDRLSGGSGPDQLLGGPGRDRLDGGPGGDDLAGGPGRDTVIGGPGDDGIQGASGDRLLGGAGDDRIFLDRSLHGGATFIDAGAGNDEIASLNGARDIVRCGPGRDRVLADRGDRLIGCEVRVHSIGRLTQPSVRGKSS